MRNIFLKEKNNQRGITLIALVITIIVLLILAGISLVMLTGPNGLLSKATQAGENSIIGEEKERVAMAYNGALTVKMGDTVTSRDMQDELDRNGTDAIASDGEEEGTIKVTFRVTNNVYVVYTNGTIVLSESNDSAGDSEDLSDEALINKLRNETGDATIDQYGNIGDISDWRIVHTGEDTCSTPTDGWSGPRSYYGDESEVVIPKYFKDGGKIYKLTNIGTGTFYSGGMSDDKITSVIIPDSVTSIGDYTFKFCTKLTNVIIPNSVTSIGNEAFSYCYSLTSITIPNSVTSIGGYAFGSCSNLTNITIQKEENSITSSPWGASSATITWTGN